MNKKTIATLVTGALISTTLLIASAALISLNPSADGTYTAWTPKSGTTHYTMVDEASCNGTTDYVSTATVGARDSYTVSLAGVPDNATITDIAIRPCASRNSSGGGSSVMNVFYRLNGANSADAGAYALTGTTPANLATTTFSGLSVTKTSSTALELGAVYSSGTKGARLSKIAVAVTYTNPVTYSIISSAGPNGFISPLGTSTVTQGSNKSYFIMATSTYVIDDILVDGVSAGISGVASTTYTFTNVQTNHTISATFRQ